MLYAWNHEAMNQQAGTGSFTLVLQDTTHSEYYEGVRSFVGEDASGSFGILPGHTRFMASLVMGLSRFRLAEKNWQYIASPQTLLYFNDNVLTLSSRHFLVDDDYMRVSRVLEEQLLEEESQLHSQKQSLRRMEEEVLQRLWELGRSGA